MESGRSLLQNKLLSSSLQPLHDRHPPQAWQGGLRGALLLPRWDPGSPKGTDHARRARDGVPPVGEAGLGRTYDLATPKSRSMLRLSTSRRPSTRRHAPAPPEPESPHSRAPRQVWGRDGGAAGLHRRATGLCACRSKGWDLLGMARWYPREAAYSPLLAPSLRGPALVYLLHEVFRLSLDELDSVALSPVNGMTDPGAGGQRVRQRAPDTCQVRGAPAATEVAR